MKKGVEGVVHAVVGEGTLFASVAEEAGDAPELDTTPSGLHHVMIFGRCSEVRWLLGHVLPCKGDTP